jgi:hypothetical protein
MLKVRRSDFFTPFSITNSAKATKETLFESFSGAVFGVD